ncbi:hypothetical protein LguiA_027223 [Lonicera macranthoides]
MTLGASALYGFMLLMIELTYKRAKQRIDYSLVMEMQVVIALFATAICTIGMLVNHDFKAIPREAMQFELGEGKYCVTLIFSGILAILLLGSNSKQQGRFDPIPALVRAISFPFLSQDSSPSLQNISFDLMVWRQLKRN